MNQDAEDGYDNQPCRCLLLNSSKDVAPTDVQLFTGVVYKKTKKDIKSRKCIDQIEIKYE